MNRTFRLLLGAVAVLATTACGEPIPVDDSPDAIAPAPVETVPVASVPASLTMARLQTVSLQLPALGIERISLRQGSFQRQSPFVVVTLEQGVHTVGDFDQDGVPEVAVVVTAIQGLPTAGQPPLRVSHLVLFGDANGSPRQEAVLQLPMGVRVLGVRVDRGIVEVDQERSSPAGDVTQRTVRYRVTGGSFQEF